ncbi:hypothetical protein GC101_03950 [Paenibacillus sp. LMG 31459]|jgi:hypothetical protein|uniref:Uncharacterized protein n=1 Tax=Paenibacillus phytohabitans TaxID=2654978 RepID=A0ABX1YAT2_9BACL|nr:hypothetical protein [Paenibacillus phytohabitans]NOU78027.1 hypothetical protein [Paenibacillus phytohabitans]
MKYKNNPAESLGEDEMLPFVQQFWIWAEMRREMLYYGQDFIKITGSMPQKADDLGIPAPITLQLKYK